ncbi:hypothetical protein CY34DRAFT_675371 [Suillus luteus UH-Slu-Lm8-n1]|uniref:Uncharacterized protein n=1 Tax=Suillus luteus UH-Slu-Lm8-n1 TaxID=930992 RepID=A0A0D0AID1_9AGAM|nr:hypothetical protein CY34DRAFT_675371 [Suillus luteus UH-Slu-Lm8-n1]
MCSRRSSQIHAPRALDQTIRKFEIYRALQLVTAVLPFATRVFFSKSPSIHTVCRWKPQRASASSAFRSVLLSLGNLFPRIQSMTLRHRPVADLGDQGIQHISELRALHSLKLGLRVPSTWAQRLHPQRPGNHDLHSLQLSIDNVEYACNFFATFKVARSREITIFFKLQFPAHESTMLSRSPDRGVATIGSNTSLSLDIRGWRSQHLATPRHWTHFAI